MVRVFLLAMVLLAGVFDSTGAFAQTKKDSSAASQTHRIYTPRDRTIEVWGGIGHPLSHAAFKRYWMRGPAAGFAIHVRATEHVKLGFGVEATLFSFRRANFALWNANVPVQVKDIVSINVFLSLRRYLQPFRWISPYLGAEVGFSRISGAEYKTIVNDVRVTYYDIPGSLRLTASAVVGVDKYLSPRVAVQAEARLMYIHNDPNVGLFLGGRAGFKFSL